MKLERWRVTSRWHIAIIHLVVVIVPLTSLAVEEDSWKVYENGYFKAFSNAKETDAVEMLRDLEIFRLISRQLSPVPIPEGSLKTLAVIFRTRLEFNKYSPPHQLIGYATFSENLGIIVLSASNRGISARHVMRHEFAHILQLYHRIRLPNWYREGLAEVLSAINIHDQTFTVGQLPEWRRNRVSKIVSYEKIIQDDFDLKKPSTVTNGADTYWQCWLLTHYVLFGAEEDFKRKFEKYLRLFGEGMSSRDAFPTGFEMEPGELWSKHLKRYRKKMPTYQGHYDRTKADTAFSIESARKREVNAILEFLKEGSEN